MIFGACGGGCTGCGFVSGLVSSFFTVASLVSLVPTFSLVGMLEKPTFILVYENKKYIIIWIRLVVKI